MIKRNKYYNNINLNTIVMHEKSQSSPHKNQVYKIPEHANQSVVTENIFWLNPGKRREHERNYQGEW